MYAVEYVLRRETGGSTTITETKVAVQHGAMPYIAFKSTHTGRGGGLWAKMFHMFHFNQAEFAAHYHKRSNVESTFSMIKAKFRDTFAARPMWRWSTKCFAKSSATIFAC